MEGHYVKLREAYDALLLVKDPKIITETHGHEKQKTFGKYVWDIFTAVYEMDDAQRFQLVLNVLGDYKKLSLNPAGVFKKPLAAPLGKMAASLAAKKASTAASYEVQ